MIYDSQLQIQHKALGMISSMRTSRRAVNRDRNANPQLNSAESCPQCEAASDTFP